MTPSFVNKHRNGKLKRYFYYQCVKTKKYDWNSCPTKQVNSDKLERLIFRKLESISKDKFYLDALVSKFSRENSDVEYREGVELRETENQFSAETLKSLLKNVLKIIKFEKGASGNLKIKKYISEILYSPEEIKIIFNNSSLLDSSTSLSSMSADRRLSADESRVVENLRAEDLRISAGTREQMLGGVGSESVLDGSSQGSILNDGCRRRIRTPTDGARVRCPAIRRAGNFKNFLPYSLLSSAGLFWPESSSFFSSSAGFPCLSSSSSVVPFLTSSA